MAVSTSVRSVSTTSATVPFRSQAQAQAKSSLLRGQHGPPWPDPQREAHPLHEFPR